VTPLGKRLTAIRERIVAAGVPLLTIEDVQRETEHAHEWLSGTLAGAPALICRVCGEVTKA
jgi:hypothetical protein